jgi:hypothetical protein
MDMDCTESTIPLLLFTGRCLVMARCCNSTILALRKYATLYTEYKLESLKRETTLETQALMGRYYYNGS